jgi:hypothetical protein
MLTIELNPTYQSEREYIVAVLLGEFLGLDYRIDYRRRADVQISADDGCSLRMADVFFQTSESQWLTARSLPSRNIKQFDPGQVGAGSGVNAVRVPLIFGEPVPETSIPDYITLDIFGSAFFMLSRYEEFVEKAEDVHGRFPAAASLALENDFLDRPVVNEYLEILWTCLKRRWPGLTRNRRRFRIIATHDVDIPYEFLGQPVHRLLRRSAVNLFHGYSPRHVAGNVGRWVRINRTKAGDPYDTFDWMMNTVEKSAATGVFNFMAGGRLPMDHYYPIEAAHIRGLVKKLIRNGHEIGFHPSYKTAGDNRLWKSEYLRLKTVLGPYPLRGGRQHFLRFKVPITWRYWADNGLKYDSTLGFADHAGFRCGTCYEYPVYDLENRRVLPLRERPLIAMDASVIDERYMGLGPTEAAVDYLLELKRHCQRFDGDYVLLWHNQRFTDPREREIYRTVIA